MGWSGPVVLDVQNGKKFCGQFVDRTPYPHQSGFVSEVQTNKPSGPGSYGSW